MARISGCDGTVTLNSSAKLGVTEWSYEESQGALDATGMGDDWALRVPEGHASGSAHVTAYYDTAGATGQPIEPNDHLDGAVTCVFTGTATVPSVTGDFIITKMALKASHAGLVTYDIDMESNDAIVVAYA